MRYPAPHDENAGYFLNGLKSALLKCVKEANAQVMFLPHLMNVDSDMYDEFADGFPEGSIFSIHRELPHLYAPPGEMLYPHVPFFTNIFRQADVLIGMRFHNCVLGFGAGRPFITLGSHPKLRFFAEDVGLTRYNLPLTDPRRETADEMYKIIRDCLDNAAYKDQVRSSLNIELAKLKSFNQRLLDVVN